MRAGSVRINKNEAGKIEANARDVGGGGNAKREFERLHAAQHRSPAVVWAARGPQGACEHYAVVLLSVASLSARLSCLPSIASHRIDLT